MLKVVLFLYKWRLAYIFFVGLLIVAIDSIQPLLLKLVLAYFESDNMDDICFIGFILIIITFICSILYYPLSDLINYFAIIWMILEP